ncbi:hypothetical protein JXA47_05240 [Candidatus Sumerlaeota bacterium]|nr:hypothetical protein [Candidatus Sumerlaeota bacterium]
MPATGNSHWVAALAIGLAAAIPGQGLPTFSGDLDRDEMFTAPDVVLTVNTAVSAEATSGENLVVADADQDGSLTSGDANYVAQIIVGLVPPLPLGGQPIGSGASLWFQPPDPESTGVDARLLGATSLWFQTAVPAAMEIDTVVLGSPSFDRQ